jgi:TatD DNase family protein
MQKDDFGIMAELAKHNKVVAIGEIGLDYYRNKAPREIQLQVFRWQLELAEKTDLPVVIHSRQADSDTLVSLREWINSAKRNREAAGVIHCFSGDAGIARQYLDMGFYISFGAYIGYPSSSLSEVIRSIPADRLLLETDSPFLPPQSHRGKRNEPAYLPMTLAVLARFRNESPEILAQQTTENAARIFYRLA